MPAVRKNLPAMDYRTSYNLALRLKDSNGTPLDLTGFTLRMDVFTPGRENELPLLSLDGLLTTDGWVDIHLDDEDNTLSPGKKAYRIDLGLPDGNTERLLFGPLEVRSGVNN